jgi:hypothetical protein
MHTLTLNRCNPPAAEAQRLFKVEQQAKEEAKASAMAKLTALGLNEQEVEALIR